MKKTAINIAVLIIVFAIAWFSSAKVNKQVIDNTVVDTVRVSVPYEVEKIVETERPVRVIEYITKYDTIETVRVVKDTVYVNNFAYNARFLTTYPQSPRFLGLDKRNGKLNLTYQSTNGETQGKTWQVGNRGYTVGLSDGQPNIRTFNDNKIDFTGSIEAGYIRFFQRGGPYLQFNSEIDILGLNTTGSINVNENPFGTIGIKYEF